jgi:Domain of unknown function (DUF4442)
MPESWASRKMRWGFNLFPAFRGTGARVTYIASDFREVRVKLPLNWRTRNYVGTIFGGSLYGAVDPHYMIMLIRILGPEYVVWDKAATVADDAGVVSASVEKTVYIRRKPRSLTSEPGTRSCRGPARRKAAT